MANPNIVNVSAIYGKSTTSNLTSTSVTTVLDNPASSGKIIKVNTLNIANYNVSAANITVFLSNGSNTTGTSNGILAAVTIPGNATLNIIDKSSQYYLEENRSFGAFASVGNYLSVTVSYEDIS